MERLFEALRPAIRGIARRPIATLTGALLLVGLGAWFGLQLRIDPDLSHLIPDAYPSVQALQELRDEVGGESDAAVVIQSPSFAANKRFAEALIPRALRLQPDRSDEPYFTYVDYRRDVGFLERNALYFATPQELRTLTQFLRDEVRAAKLEANPFYVALDDEPGAPDTTAQQLEALYRDLVRSEYPVSSDSTIMVVRLYPSGAQTNIGFIEDAFGALDRLVRRMEPSSYHPDMTVEYAGRLKRQLVEVQTITRDVVGSFGSGVATLLLLVMAYFFYKHVQVRTGGRWSARVVRTELLRAPLTALILGLPLAASLAWTFGVVYAAYGRLNLMTSTLGLILFGLGIDFGIHFYARYAEERGEGRPVAEALERTFMTTGQAIAVVAVTTAAAFFVLMIADFRGFSQFGFTAGVGTLFALLAMLVLLPALLATLEHTRLLALEARSAPAGGEPDTRAGWRFPVPRVVIALGVGVTVGAVLQLDEVAFEYDFGELEPTYEAFMQVHRKYRAVYPSSQRETPAYVLADSADAAAAVVQAVRQTMRRDTLTPTIHSVESLQDRFPMTDSARQAKLDQIAEVRSLLADPFLQASDDATLQRLRTAASPREPLSLQQVPDVLRKRFTTKEGEVGHLVIIYPSVGLSDGRNSMQFADDVGTIRTADDRVYHAASTSIVASDMLRLMVEEAPTMIGLTILLIVIFKALILRRLRWVLLALLPLAASFVWMFGLMPLFGLKLNFYNLVVLPTVLGIGDDSGIHMVHRYREEGRGSVGRVLRSTGEHITMSAVTTMVGFGGLLLSMHPGLRSIGALAVLGISMTLGAALGLVPALLQWWER
jgi:hypothetical protein